MIWESDLLQHVLVACLNCWRCMALWGAGQGECVRYLQVERWGCCYVQSENPCFGTWGKLRITHKNLGLCLGPVAAHKHFPSPHCFCLHRSYSVRVLGWGTGYCDTLSAVICTRAVTPPISSCWALRSQLCVSSTAEVTAQGLTWVCRDTTNLTGQGELAKVSQLLSFSKWFSKRNTHDFIFSYLPMGCYFRSSATCRKASGRELLCVSWELLCQDHEVCRAEAWV